MSFFLHCDVNGCSARTRSHDAYEYLPSSTKWRDAEVWRDGRAIRIHLCPKHAALSVLTQRRLAARALKRGAPKAMVSRILTAMDRYGLISLEELSVLSDEQLLGIDGIGHGGIAVIRKVCKKPEPPKTFVEKAVATAASPRSRAR